MQPPRDNSQRGYHGAPPYPYQTSQYQQGFGGRPTNPSNLPIFDPTDERNYLPTNPMPNNRPFRDPYDRAPQNTLPTNPPTSQPRIYGQERSAQAARPPGQRPYLVQPGHRLPSNPPPANSARRGHAPRNDRPNAAPSGYAHSPYPTTREPSHSRPVRTTDSQPRNANSVQAPITLSSFIPNGFKAPEYHGNSALELVKARVDAGPKEAASTYPGLNLREVEQTLVLNAALTRIANSVGEEGKYGVPETVQLVFERKFALLRPDQLRVAETLMDSYAEYKAGGTETPRIQRLKGNMNQATKGLNTGKRTVAKILDGALEDWPRYKSAVIAGGTDVIVNPSHSAYWLGPGQHGTSATLQDERSVWMKESHCDLISRINKPFDAELMRTLYCGDLTTAHGKDAQRTFRAYTQNTTQRADWFKTMTKVKYKENAGTLITEFVRRLAEIQPPSQASQSTPRSVPSYGHPAGSSHGSQSYGRY